MAKGKAKSTITTSPVPVQAVGSTGGGGGGGFMAGIKKHKLLAAGGAGVLVFGAYYLYKKHEAANAAAVPATSTAGATSGTGSGSGWLSGNGGQGAGSTGSGSGSTGSGGGGPSGGNNLSSLFSGLQTSLTAGFAALGQEITSLQTQPQQQSQPLPLTPFTSVPPVDNVVPPVAKAKVPTTKSAVSPVLSPAQIAAGKKATAGLNREQTSTPVPAAKAVAKAPNPTTKVPTTKSAVSPVLSPAQIAAGKKATAGLNRE